MNERYNSTRRRSKAGGLTKEEIRRRKRQKARKQRELQVLRARMLIMLAALLLLMILTVAGMVTAVRGKKNKEETQQNLPVSEMETGGAEMETAEAADEDEDIKLVMVGDILLHSRLEEYAKQDDGTYDYKSIFSEIKPQIKAADLALENQEVIIGGVELGVSGYPSFNAPFELADDIADAGFNVILHATNHSLDKGIEGARKCMEYWRVNHHDINVLGMHESEVDAEKIFVYRKNGIRVAILNYTQYTNKSVDKKVQSYMLDLMTKQKIHEDVANARELADFVVVCPHWGTEYSLQVDDKQQDMAEFMLKEGVDLVIGTHPHVIQPIEMMEDPETGHKMLIYYSLGNLTSWVLEDSENIGHRVTSGMAQVVIGRMEDGSVGIRDYGVEPLICHYNESVDSVVIYPLDQYPDEMAKSHLVNIFTGNFDRTYLENHFRSVWGSYKTLHLQ